MLKRTPNNLKFGRLFLWVVKQKHKKNQMKTQSTSTF